MIAQQRKLAMLERTANQLLATVAPTTARLLPARVLLETQRDTASTDGHTVIFMPADFCGHAIPDAELISVGLLAHEASHFLQPLPSINDMARQESIPHWLVNVVLDVQGESLVETIFPSLHTSLSATRQAVATAQMATYEHHLQQAQYFVEAAATILLYCRFARSDRPFDRYATDGWFSMPYGARGFQLVGQVNQATSLPPADLATFLRRLINNFPELRQASPPVVPVAAPRLQSDGPVAGILLDEIQRQVGQWTAGSTVPLLTKSYRREAPHPEAVQLARQIRPRFDSSRGAFEVLAPGRFDRQAAARGDFPFRLALPGRTQPAPIVVIGVDVSSSMDGYKQRAAFIAAQALALAVNASGGHVVGLLFDEWGAVAQAEDETPLFAAKTQWRNKDGTCFRFLTEVWRGWPHHWVLLITDGQGTIPGALPQDRARTAAIVIPDGDVAALQPICQRVVELQRLHLLPAVLATLLPRSLVG